MARVDEKPLMQDLPLIQRTIGHVLAAKATTNGDRTCLIWGERRISYTEMHALTNRYANGFRAAGVAKGDHVAVMLGNCPEFLFVVWGLGKIGAVAVPLNTAAKGDLLSYYLTQSDSTWLVTETDFAARLADVLAGKPALKGVFSLGDAGALCVRLARPLTI
jgi:carnitine-CoA ligase